MVRFRALQEKSAARRRFRRRRNRREPPEHPSANPLEPLADRRARRARPVLAARRPPWTRRASLATRGAPTRSPARHARPPPPGGAGVGAHPRGAAAVGATPTRRRADAGEALDMHFSLALACHLGKLTTEFVSRVDGSRLEARTRSEEHTSELQSRRDLVCRLL